MGRDATLSLLNSLMGDMAPSYKCCRNIAFSQSLDYSSFGLKGFEFNMIETTPPVRRSTQIMECELGIVNSDGNHMVMTRSLDKGCKIQEEPIF